MNLSPTRLSALLIAAFGLVSQLGCPGGECSTQGECGAGNYCTPDRTCAPLPGGVGDGDGDVVGDGDGDGDVTGDGDGDGDGDNGNDVLVTTSNFQVGWLMRDPRDPNKMLVPLFGNSGSTDGLYELDLNDPPNSINQPTFDIQGMQSGPCDIDMISFEGELSINNRDETWVVCGYSGGDGDLRIIYDDNFFQQTHDEGPAVQFGIPIVSQFNVNGTNWERRAWAKRGGNLTVFQLRDGNDSQYQARATDSVSGVSSVVQLWQIEGGSAADHLLVFDRADGPRLVPLMRQNGSDEWIANTQLRAVEFDREVAAVFLVPERIDAQGQNIAGDFNVVGIVPSEGRAYFYQYFGGTLLPQGNTQYSPFTFDSPDPTARLLLEAYGDYVFYAHPESSRAWRIPVDDWGQEARAFRYTNPSLLFKISGIVPVSETEAWISIPSQNQIQRVTFGPNN